MLPPPTDGCIEASDTVSDLEIRTWNDVPAQEIDPREFQQGEPNHSSPPFDISTAVNRKLAIFEGDFTKLMVDALVNPTNEHLNDKNTFSRTLIERAGPQLRKDLHAEIKTCRTGEAKITSGYDLLCRHVIHTVGPRYQQKYLSASESALHSSYRSCLTLMKEHGIRTLAIPPLHSSRRGFPPVEGAHLALRTIRRFLEEFAHDDCIQRIILLLEKADLDIYLLLLPLFFPRTQNEQLRSAHGLPKDLGGKNGEPVIPERQIRIQDKPFFCSTGNGADFSDLDMSVCVGKSSFARMQNDIDEKRKHSRAVDPADALTNEISRKNRYDRLLRKAQSMDFREIRETNIIYKSGQDKQGRSVFVFVGKNYSPSETPFELLCCYIIRMMDKEVASPFVVVYLHSMTSNKNHVSYNILRELYQILDYRYKKNLHSLHIVHPTWWSRLSMWWFTTITTSGLNGKVRLTGGIEYLYMLISPDQLNLPQFVLDYDYSINGARYSPKMYESMIKCRGKPILPPVMTQDRRTEARHYRNEAVRREQLRVQRRETNETIVDKCEGSPEKKLIRWRSEEEPMGVVQPLSRENGTSPSRIPRSASAQANLHLSRPSTQVRSRLLVDKDPSARRLRHEGPPVATPRKSRSRREPSLEASFVEQQLCESLTKLERGGTFIVSTDALDEKPQAADLDDMTERMRSEMCLNDDSVPGLLESDSPSYESATEEDFSLTLSADLSNTRDDTAGVSTVDEVSALLPESEVESQIPRRPSSLSMHTPLESPEKDVELDEQGHDGCESRKCLGRRHTYLILQAKQKTPTLSIAPTPEENHLQDLAERLQSCAHLVSSLTPKNSPMTNKSLASLHESFRRATSSTLQSSTACDDLNANRPDLGNSRRVERRLWSDRNGNRGLRDVLRQHLDPKTARGFDRFTALCKGHLCRKLLGCSRVQGVIGTITDMVQMAFELHQLEEKNTPNDLDVELHERVLLTLDDSCQELYRIFFEASSAEQIQLIRESDANHTTAGSQGAPVKRLSSATLKRRIRLQKDAELKRNPPSPFRRRCCGSNRNHPH